MKQKWNNKWSGPCAFSEKEGRIFISVGRYFCCDFLFVNILYMMYLLFLLWGFVTVFVNISFKEDHNTQKTRRIFFKVHFTLNSGSLNWNRFLSLWSKFPLDFFRKDRFLQLRRQIFGKFEFCLAKHSERL